MHRTAALLLAAALLFPAAASALSPLKPADMKTIRRDARSKAVVFKQEYGAESFHVACRKVTSYAARCRVNLVDIRAGTHDCSVILVYVVTRQHSIAGNFGRNTCD